MVDFSRLDEEHGTLPEDFLFHLYRGAEMLRRSNVHEAKEELERALRLRPRDSKGQDMLAVVYYRLGLYPHAIELYEELCKQNPDSATLHINVALVYLKTGQPREALEHLLAAVRLAPEHARAWGYLGLVQARLGQLGDARESFLRGGHPAMAQRMDAMSTKVGLPAPPPRKEDDPEVRPRDRAMMRDAVDGAFEELDEPEPFALEPTREPRKPSGTWRAVEPGGEAVPLPGRVAVPALDAVPGPPRLEDFLRATAVAFPAPGSMIVGADGVLLVHLADRSATDEGSEVGVRLRGMRAVSGATCGDPVRRRARAPELDGPLGGEMDPLVTVRGPGTLAYAPHANELLTVVRLADEALYLRETAIVALLASLAHESGSLVVDAERDQRLLLVYLVGTGAVAFAAHRAPFGVRVDAASPVRLPAASVLGWSGRVFPSPTRDGGFPDLVGFTGEGIVLVA